MKAIMSLKQMVTMKYSKYKYKKMLKNTLKRLVKVKCHDKMIEYVKEYNKINFSYQRLLNVEKMHEWQKIQQRKARTNTMPD